MKISQFFNDKSSEEIVDILMKLIRGSPLLSITRSTLYIRYLEVSRLATSIIVSPECIELYGDELHIFKKSQL